MTMRPPKRKRTVTVQGPVHARPHKLLRRTAAFKASPLYKGSRRVRNAAKVVTGVPELA